MAIPNFESLMLPLLKIATDGEEHRARDARETLAEQLGLSPEERNQLLPSGTDKVFNNRVGWALSFIRHAGLVESSRHGYFRITGRGKDVLGTGIPAITSKFLMQYPEFANWGSTPPEDKQKEKSITSELADQPVITPQEQMELGYAKLRRGLELELLAKVKACSPEFFEELVVQLLVAMGYGGSVSEARKSSRTPDGGVDGVIKEDRLGLDQIYLQAKRWSDATVGRPDVQGFVGALLGRKARRGVFITTSTFTKGAQEYADSIDTATVILINGPKLAEYMVEFGIGVARVRQYDIKAIDHDFFEEDDDSPVAAKAVSTSS